ncbi:Olfactory receptor 2T29 [Sciurus carolinensis]|uniref:Olfactory receptor 2T29 n=1 Tax=Sciurus carolinensis TaxID=30640 RepID=A0AA41SPN0_SCICA|nr:Olfactory receptor 2T29 [Sciurus carolinensis]
MDSFISQLSLMDLMHIAVTVPKTLVAQVTGDHTISPAGCGIQMFFCLTLAGAEFFLLSAMACDRTSSAKGRRKALATCSSHVSVVLLFFGAAVYTYMLPSSYHTAQQDVTATAFHSILTSELNPLIYSLRNKDIMVALRSLVESRGPRCDLGPPVVLLPPPDLLCHSGS